MNKEIKIIYTRNSILKAYLNTLLELFQGEAEITEILNQIKNRTNLKVTGVSVNDGTAKVEVENDPRETEHIFNTGNNKFSLHPDSTCD